MIDSELANQRISESLAGFPAGTVAAYRSYAETGNPTSLDAVVLGVLHFYLATKPDEPIESLPGSTKLVEDLGGDSLAMMDTVFMIESLFDVKVDDTELPKLVTLDDLKNHLRRLVKGGTPLTS